MPLAAFPKCYLDIDRLELYWGFTPAGDTDALLALRRRIEATGLTMPMMCYSPDFIKHDIADRDREVEKQKRASEVTALLVGKKPLQP